MTPRLRIATHGGRNLECSWRVRARASAARRQGIASGCLSLLIENNSLFGPKISLFSITGNSGLQVRNHSGFRTDRARRRTESVKIPCTFPVEQGFGRGDQFERDFTHRHFDGVSRGFGPGDAIKAEKPRECGVLRALGPGHPTGDYRFQPNREQNGWFVAKREFGGWMALPPMGADFGGSASWAQVPPPRPLEF